MKTLLPLSIAALVFCSSSCSLPSHNLTDPAESSIDAFFSHVSSRVREPLIFGGEYDENLLSEGLGLLSSLGDKRFAKILKARGQKDRSAVRLILPKNLIEPVYPETAKVLRSSKKCDWPMKEATLEFEKSSGETAQSAADTW